MAGRIDWFFAPMVSAPAADQDGKLKALAVGTAKRSTRAAAGADDGRGRRARVRIPVLGRHVRAGEDACAIVDRLDNEVAKIMASPDIKERLDKLGAEPFLMTPAAFDKFLADETAKAQQIVRAADIKLN